MNPKNVNRLKEGDKCIVINASSSRFLLNQVIEFIKEDFGSDRLIFKCPYKGIHQYIYPRQFKIWKENETI